MADEQMESLQRLDSDLKTASRLLGKREARFLTDEYYQIQEYRKASSNQVRASSGTEPNDVLDWVSESTRRLEDNIKRALNEFSKSYKVGAWLMSITGIGPVLSAGFLTHLSVNPWRCCQKNPRERCKPATKCSPVCDYMPIRTAGHFWNFAGLNPDVKWEKGHIRPWNAKLKVLCYKTADCFVKFQNHKDDYYGKLYVQRKEYETRRNDSGGMAETAARILTEKNYAKDTEAKKCYESGKLPPGHIHSRCLRWVEKIFLSHLHHAMHHDYFGTDPVKPYAFEKCNLDHRDYIPLPNWPNQETGKSLRDMAE